MPVLLFTVQPDAPTPAVAVHDPLPLPVLVSRDSGVLPVQVNAAPAVPVCALSAVPAMASVFGVKLAELLTLLPACAKCTLTAVFVVRPVML